MLFRHWTVCNRASCRAAPPSRPPHTRRLVQREMSTDCAARPRGTHLHSDAFWRDSAAARRNRQTRGSEEAKKEVHLGSPWNAALTFKKKSGRLPPRKKVALTPNFRQIQVTREEPRKKDERYDQYCRATFQISRSMARLPDHFFQDSSLARRWQEDSNS